MNKMLFFLIRVSMDHLFGSPALSTYLASIYANNIHGMLELGQFSDPSKLLSWKNGASCHYCIMHYKCNDKHDARKSRKQWSECDELLVFDMFDSSCLCVIGICHIIILYTVSQYTNTNGQQQDHEYTSKKYKFGNRNILFKVRCKSY